MSETVLRARLPSGPSQADELIARRLSEPLAPTDVCVLGQLIVPESIFSFSKAGLI
jgi:DNA repair protein RadC